MPKQHGNLAGDGVKRTGTETTLEKGGTLACNGRRKARAISEQLLACIERIRDREAYRVGRRRQFSAPPACPGR